MATTVYPAGVMLSQHPLDERQIEQSSPGCALVQENALHFDPETIPNPGDKKPQMPHICMSSVSVDRVCPQAVV